MGDSHTGSAELEKPDPGAKEPKEKSSSHERATFWLEFVGVLGVIGALSV
jgi:hypothetical protein